MAVSPPEGLMQLATAVDDHHSALSEAWAHHRSVSGKAHFAAVMGNAESTMFPPGYMFDNNAAINADISRCVKTNQMLNAALRALRDGSTETFEQARIAVLHVVQKMSNMAVDTFMGTCMQYINEKSVEQLDQELFQVNSDGKHGLEEYRDDLFTATADLNQAKELYRIRLNEYRSAVTRAVVSPSQVHAKETNRAKAVSTYTNDIKFINSEVEKMTYNHDAITEISERIEGLKTTYPSGADLYISEDYKNLNSAKANIDKALALSELVIVSHLDKSKSNASQSRLSEKSTHTIKMNLVPHTETTKGFKMILSLEDYITKKAPQYWAIVPEIRRMLRDIDPNTGLHWRPSAQDRENDSMWTPKMIKVRRDQALSFATTLLSEMPNQATARAALLATGSYGVHRESFKAKEDDGVEILWVYLQKIHPTDNAQQRIILDKIEKVARKLSDGNPKAQLDTLSELSQEASDMGAPLDWFRHGCIITSALTSRGGPAAMRYESGLREYDAHPKNNQDYGEIIDDMIATAKSITDELLNSEGSKAFSAMQAMTQNELQGAIAKAVRDGGKTAKAATGRKPPYSNSKPKSEGCEKGGTCQKVGCNQKVQGWTKSNNWKLCSTCILEVRTKGKSVPLKDGSTFAPRREGDKLLAAMATANVGGVKIQTAFKVMRTKKTERNRKLNAKRARADFSDQSEGEDDDPKPSKKSMKSDKKPGARAAAHVRNLAKKAGIGNESD